MLDKEAKIIETELKLFPDNIELIFDIARLALSGKNTGKANELIERYKYLSRQNGQSDGDIQKMLDLFYEQAKSYDVKK